MSTDTALIEKREELKRRLAAGEYKTLVDVFLERFDRLIRKITNHTKPFPIWLITLILTFIVPLLCFVVIYIADDLTYYSETTRLNKLGYGFGILFDILGLVLPIVGTVVFNQHIRRIFVFLCDEMLDAVRTLPGLQQCQYWLENVCNRRLHLSFLLIISVGSLIKNIYVMHLNHYGVIFTATIGVLIFFSIIYLFFMTIFLSVKLGNLDLTLFTANPAASKIVSNLYNQLNYVIYFVAVFAAINTYMFFTWGEMVGTVNVNLIFFIWLPLTVMFVLNQTSLSSVIRRAKMKTLTEIQIRVEKIHGSRNFGNQETMDTINRLIDYHDRVKATPNSLLNFGSALNFINSLLLPLIAFLLGNLNVVVDFVLWLFGKTR